jgi:GAF domain-containing protein
MPQKRSPLPGWSSSMPGATSPRSTSVAELRPPPHVLSLLVRPTAPPLVLGLVVAGSLLVAETLLGYLLSRVAPEDALGVVYLLGVLVIAIGWGFWLAAATAVASTLAFDFFLIAPIGSLTVTDPRDWVALAIFLMVALVASTAADLARRAAAADQRRREAELAAELGRVVTEQQAALRRVATLVARGATSSEVFSALAEEMARCLNADNASVSRFDGETLLILALARMEAGMKNKPQVGESLSSAGDNIATRVFHTGRPARLNSAEMQGARGPMAAGLRKMGLRCTVAVPIVVDGNVWGMAAVGSTCPEPMAPDTEQRLGDFADLVATAIANAATRDELQASRGSLAGLATQQSALRRVATLVARGASPSEVFSVVAEEMARCLNAGNAGVGRFEGDEVVVLAVSQFDQDMKNIPVVGERFALDGDNFVARVFRTGAAARVDSSESQNAPGPIAARVSELGLGCTVAVPIVVDGRVWGTATVGAAEQLPPDTEERMSDFADLVATAIANAATRSELIASRARIVAAADEGRRRLERDLHDGAHFGAAVAAGRGLSAARPGGAQRPAR